LGSLLFSIYINNLPKASKFEARLYADDTALILSGKSSYELNKNVNNELLKVESWLKSNKLFLKFTKIKHLIIIKLFRKITSELSNFNVGVKGIKLKKCAAAKFLGVILVENLNWKQHKLFIINNRNYHKLLV